jgi:molybdopterin-guanine dinucleotide biosynthesis protein A
MITLAILTGGNSTRMGQDKALMPFMGRPLILSILDRLAPLADEIILSTNRPVDYAFLDLPGLPDLQPGLGPLGGLCTVLQAARNPLVAAVACDMPFASLALFEYERDLLTKTGADAVVPSTPKGLEPLHATYLRQACLPVIQKAIEAGKLKMTGWLSDVKVQIIPPKVTSRYDPSSLAFWNLNTPEDFRLAEQRTQNELDVK